MEKGKPIAENLAKGGMTLDDLWAKLREANAFDIKQVHAVVLESTGDVSVLHGPQDGPTPSRQVLDGVRRD
ncbi:YetF domain-containing protein [Marimonas sp. MJW-29]|uniref:YetF domain-containing protein n=1 Tax=Sulfitobacter sediminis TaxID=3234186 RepID=A0ABV3RHW4_9RHOB